jgi:hypothetical protein
MYRVYTSFCHLNPFVLYIVLIDNKRLSTLPRCIDGRWPMAGLYLAVSLGSWLDQCVVFTGPKSSALTL